MQQPRASTATRAPNVCIPDPKVRSHGTKMCRLIDGGMAATKIAAVTRATARSRDSFVLSVSPATSTSNAPTSERYPAHDSPTKNTAPNSAPAGICAKTLGSVAKISPGPDVGSRLNANTAGMTANPASSDEPVSPMTVHSAGRDTLSSDFMYDPY